MHFTFQILLLIIFCQEYPFDAHTSLWTDDMRICQSMAFENDFIILLFSAIVPYYVTVILTYHGVTEDAISSVGAEDVAGMEEAGSGVDLDLSILDILLIFLLINQFFPLVHRPFCLSNNSDPFKECFKFEQEMIIPRRVLR